MATLYVENIPDDLNDALRGRARENRKSIAAEVVALLEENVPTARELKARRAFLRKLQRLRTRRPSAPGPLPSSENLQCEDRSR